MDDDGADCADAGAGCTQSVPSRRLRGTEILPAARYPAPERRRRWQCHRGRHEPVLLYIEPWHRRHGHLRQLHRQESRAGGRVRPGLRAGHAGGALLRPHYLPRLLYIQCGKINAFLIYMNLVQYLN